MFHRALCECEFVNKKLANVDEYVRLQAKAHHKEAAEEAAYDAIGAVMRTESDTPRELLDAIGSEPVLKACALVGHAFGIEVRGNPGATEDLAYEEQVAAIAASSGFRTRLVMLRDDWWNYDHGPLLGQHAESRLPVALLQTGTRTYEYINPKTGERGKVNAKVGETLTPFGFTFYRPFQDGSLTVRQVIAFAARGLGSDIKWLLFTAVAIGMFGSATPYFTGKIFDEAMPAGRPRDAVRLRRRADVLGAGHRRLQVRPGRHDHPHPVADAEQRPGGGLGSAAQPAGQLLPQVRRRRPRPIAPAASTRSRS